MNTSFCINDFRAQDFIFNGYTILGSTINPIAIPDGTSNQLKKYLSAALVADTMGNKSIDRTLQAYGDGWIFDDKKSEFEKYRDELLQTVQRCYTVILDRRKQLDGLPDHIGLIRAGAAFMRLENSFQITLFLAKRDLYFECACVLKLILEQIAWAFSVYEIDAHDHVNAVSPSGSITALKTIIPYAGKVYGYLNNLAHIDTKLLNELIHIDEQGAAYSALGRPTRVFQLGYYALIVADIFGIVMELIYRDHFSSFDYICTQGDPFVLRQDRCSKKDIKLWHKRLNSDFITRLAD